MKLHDALQVAGGVALVAAAFTLGLLVNLTLAVGLGLLTCAAVLVVAGLVVAAPSGVPSLSEGD